MPTTIDCASCRKKFRIPDHLVGKRLGCPHCKAPVASPPLPKHDEEVPEIENVEVIGEEDKAAAEAIVPVAQLAVPPPGLEPPPNLEPVNVRVLDDEEDATPYTVREDSTGVDCSVSGSLAEVRLKSDSLGCVALGPDLNTAVVGDEQSLWFVDLKARKAERGRRMHGSSITCLCLSADGRLALSGDTEGGLLLWDLAGRRALRWLDGHRDELRAVGFSADGTHAASAGRGGAVRLWRIPGGEKLALDRGRFDEAVNCVRFSPDGRLLVAIGDQGRARLWRVPGGESAVKLQKGPEDLHAAAFSKDGAFVLATSGNRFKVCKWDVHTGEKRSCFPGYDERLPRVRKTWISPDGHGLLALHFLPDYGPRARDDRPPDLLVGGGVLVGSLVGGLIGGCAGGIIRTATWAATKGAENIVDSALGPSGMNYSLQLWDVAYENPVKSVTLSDDPQALACSCDGRRALVGFDDGIVRLYGL